MKPSVVSESGVKMINKSRFVHNLPPLTQDAERTC